MRFSIGAVDQPRNKKITRKPKVALGTLNSVGFDDPNDLEMANSGTLEGKDSDTLEGTDSAALEAANAVLLEGPLLETLSAALLAAGQPLKPKEISNLLGVPTEAAHRLIETLRRRFTDASLGFDIEAVAGGYRLIVAQRVVSRLEPLMAPPALPGLSPASLETLAIIAYRQPVTRGEIELMRGASAGSTLETLQERELVKVVGRKEDAGRPMLYGTTERFLIEFGLSHLSDLPALDEDDLGGFLRG
jgi:segregation and condensation protein B